MKPNKTYQYDGVSWEAICINCGKRYEEHNTDLECKE